MARPPVQRMAITEQLRPVATPVDTFVQPARSPLLDFAESLSQIDRPLKQFLDDRSAKQAEEDAIRGEAAFYSGNDDGLAEAVRSGKIPSHYSPTFVRSYKKAQGDAAGVSLKRKFDEEWMSWEGKNGEDPEAYDQFMQDFLQRNIGTEDPDVLRGLLPHINEVERSASATYTAYRDKQTYEGNLTSTVAAANREVEDAAREGLSNPEGTNYARVFAAIGTRRQEFVSSGGRPEDFDKAMIDAMSLKVLQEKDPGLLAWFEQEVPGAGYTYGESPYGAAVKQETVDKLEVVARRAIAEEQAQISAADKAAKDAVELQAIEALSADPSAPLSEELITEGSKYDPQFRVKVEDWRKSLSSGFTDPDRLKAVYSEVLNGGGYKAVEEAASAGVFGRPEDLTAAYNFAKGYEDNKDRVDEVLGGSVARNIFTAINERTKDNDVLNPLDGMTNEGFEADYDYRRMVQEWVISNPDASVQETQDAVSRIGKQVLDRFTEADIGRPSEYERPGDLGFDNPFSDGQTPPVEPEPVAPAEATSPNVDGRALLEGLEPEQRGQIEALARASGLSPEAYIERLSQENADEGVPEDEPDETGAVDLRENPLTPEQASQYLDEALAAGESVAAYGVAGDPTTDTLLSLIRQHEATDNYNAVYGNARSTRELSQFSLDQILEQQRQARASGKASTAIGAYQFIYKTLRGLKTELGLSGEEPFTPELQDRLAMALLERRGLNEFKNGTLSKRGFALRLSQEWASLANPDTGRSFYDGDGLNRSSASAQDVYAALGFQNASLSSDQSMSSTPVRASADPYANIPDVDGGGNAGQREKFLQWNPDPIGNHDKNLRQIDQGLASVVRRASQISSVPFVIGSGKRDAELQKKAVEWGWSRTEDSDHLDGGAVDLWPVTPQGSVVFEEQSQREIVRAMKQAAEEMGVNLDVGADWKSFTDLPHFAITSTNT